MKSLPSCLLIAIMLALCTPAFAADPCTCAPCKCCKACCADGVQSLPAVPTPAKPSGGPLDLKITWPDWLQGLSKQALEAAWWDGARTGGFIGAGVMLVLWVVAVQIRGTKPSA